MTMVYNEMGTITSRVELKKGKRGKEKKKSRRKRKRKRGQRKDRMGVTTKLELLCTM